VHKCREYFPLKVVVRQEFPQWCHSLRHVRSRRRVVGERRGVVGERRGVGGRRGEKIRKIV
jgi:tryptophan 2,3-dioxygenase